MRYLFTDNDKGKLWDVHARDLGQAWLLLLQEAQEAELPGCTTLEACKSMFECIDSIEEASAMINDEEKDKVFLFLDGLRESGTTNMFGASPYLVRELGLDKSVARALLSEWMMTFSQRHPKEAKKENVCTNKRPTSQKNLLV